MEKCKVEILLGMIAPLIPQGTFSKDDVAEIERLVGKQGKDGLISYQDILDVTKWHYNTLMRKIKKYDITTYKLPQYEQKKGVFKSEFENKTGIVLEAVKQLQV